MLYTICIALILIASVLIILAVLVQNPKSGMAANFGASNQVMGVRETTNFLEKFTWTMAIAIVVLSLVATLAMDKGLVAESNSEISKDAKALQEQMLNTEAVPANFGASNQVMGVRETTNFLEKFTWTMAIAIVVLSLVATLAMDKGLVAESNSEISKDAKALQEQMLNTEAVPAMPQAELPAEQPAAEPAASSAE